MMIFFKAPVLQDSILPSYLLVTMIIFNSNFVRISYITFLIFFLKSLLGEEQGDKVVTSGRIYRVRLCLIISHDKMWITSFSWGMNCNLERCCHRVL